jgi:NAD+ kinase
MTGKIVTGIFGRAISEGRKSYIRNLYQGLVNRNATLCIYEPFLKITRHLLPENARISTFTHRQDIPEQMACMLTIGGDGTLLEAVTHVRDSKIPLLGINTGRLGFLSGFSKEEIDLAAEMAVKGNYQLDRRALIRIGTRGKYFGETPFALNEVTFHKRDTSSMITLHVKMNEQHLNTYWADGLIISTPTGSTGYSLSCGGPIMMPDSKNIIITPIAPHNLNVRPLVIADTSKLSIEAEVRGKYFMVSLDSRSAIVPVGEKISIRKAGFSILLARKPDQSFLLTLREKLMWGTDKRN